MRKERLQIVENVTEQLHAVEAAMDTVMTEFARLGVTILEARAKANLSPLLGAEIFSSHAAGHDSLSRFMGHMVNCHASLRDLGGKAMPGVAIGDTPARLHFREEVRPDVRPHLVASA